MVEKAAAIQRSVGHVVRGRQKRKCKGSDKGFAVPHACLKAQRNTGMIEYGEQSRGENTRR